MSAAVRRVRPIDWIVAIGVFLVGLFFLGVAEFGRRYGTTPESALTVVTGPAQLVSTSRVSGVEYVRFAVQGYSVDYASDQRGYRRLHAAIQTGTPVTVGISTRRETLIAHPDWAALYTLAINGEVLQTYTDTVTRGYRGSHAPYIVGGFLFLLGLWALAACVRNHRRSTAQPQLEQSPAQAAAAWAEAWGDPRRLRVAATLVSVLLYGATLAAVLHPDSMPTSTVVFGPRPLGLPLPLFVWAYFTVLSIPLPFAAWHAFRILFRGAAEGTGFGRGDILRSLIVTPTRHADLRRSRRIVLGIAAFYVALMAGWIAYASAYDVTGRANQLSDTRGP